MAALCPSYSSHAEAFDAVNAVLGAGIPGEGVRVVTGEPQRDTDAGLDEDAAERDVDALHAGRVLVLVTAPQGEVERVRALLGG